MDFTGFLLAATAGLVAPPVLLAALWRASRHRAAPRAARVAACAALALIGTALIAAVIGQVWRERDAVLGAMLVAPASLALSAAIAWRDPWGWALLPPVGALVTWLVWDWAL